MTSCPKEWKALVKSSLTYAGSSYDDTMPQFNEPANLYGHTCDICGKGGRSFPISKALAAHMRRAHGVRCMYRVFVDGSGLCPICKTYLHTRLRVIAHLSDPRRNLKCREAIHNGTVPRLPDSLVAELDALDTGFRRTAQRAGLSHPVAHKVARRQDGRKSGRPAAH